MCVVVSMRMVQRDWHQMQVTVAHSGLGNDCLRERLNLVRWATQNHRFDAVVVVEVGMRG